MLLTSNSRPAASTLAHAASRTLLLLCLAISSQAIAQTEAVTAAAWRASSRLGYGPIPSNPLAPQADSKNWALQQIDEAFAASQQPPVIPAELAGFNEPINRLVRSYQAEREARNTTRQQTAAPVVPVSTAALPMMPAGSNADPVNFSRNMAQTASAWRLVACSNPAIEQPMLARMTEFWFNHLNVFAGKGTVRPFVGSYVLSAIRPNALGKFEDLLLASARHPAMLFYLDQAQSNVRGLNENYARELMELHTMGVNSGYSQADVRELARILTGWTVPLQRGEGFTFVPRLHDQGDKTLLGQSFRANGVQEGEDAIRMLARHPATAQRIARRLATTFVSDEPSQALVDRLATTFTQTQGDIHAIMRTLVTSPEFWAAGNTLFKTPMDFACSALTASGGARDRPGIQQTLGFLAQAGQPVHGWQTPDGYKTSAATWLAPEALTRRADYAMALGNRADRAGNVVNLEPFLSPASRQRIAREAEPDRLGLMLASPDFMSK